MVLLVAIRSSPRQLFSGALKFRSVGRLADLKRPFPFLTERVSDWFDGSVICLVSFLVSLPEIVKTGVPDFEKPAHWRKYRSGLST